MPRAMWTWAVFAMLSFGVSGGDVAAFAATAQGSAGSKVAYPARADGARRTSWMTDARYGMFVHYQYRMLLGYCIRTNPQFPEPGRMTAVSFTLDTGEQPPPQKEAAVL